jgi:hypothetical protein
MKISLIQDALERVKLLKKYQGNIYLCLDKSILEQVYKQMGRPAITIHREHLHWIPYKFKYEY